MNTTRKNESDKRMPLNGIRVLECSIWQQGPVCTAMLGDLGADVIKIEERESGDPGRGLARMYGMDLSDRPNFYFEANNRNKKSITLDLRKREAIDIVYKLVTKSDVFVQNFRKGVMDRLGLDYATLRQHNPKLIYANASGYGPEGPDSNEPAFDFMGLARSGIMLAAGEPDMPPLGVTGGVVDQMGAIMLAYGILVAVIARERFGVGQKVDVSQLSSMMMLQGLSISARLVIGSSLPRLSRKQAFNPLWNHYCCKDGKWIALAMLQSDRYWADFCRALGREDLTTDERFVDQQSRGHNSEAAVAVFDAVFETKPRDEWIQILRSSPSDFIFTVVNSIDDLPDDPQVRANDYVIDFDHPQFGKTQVLGMPVSLSETPGQVRTPAPQFGQHTEEILLELLGYSWEQIGDLRSREVI